MPVAACRPTMGRRRVFAGLFLLTAFVTAHSALAGEGLHPALQRWLDNEQGRLSRSVNPARIMQLSNGQDPRFAPETGAVFNLRSYWIDADQMISFRGAGMSPETESLFTRSHNGVEQVRLLVHPESKGFYSRFVAKPGVHRADDFRATPTASSRTLVAWPNERPDLAFFAKVSLDKRIGGVVRTVSAGEVARSIGINDVLHAALAAGELPRSFAFVPETFSTIPRGMTEGGMVVREVPAGVKRGDWEAIPFFSLYATGKGGQEPWLVEMIRNSGMPAEDFLRHLIIRPFAQQWIDLAILGGINAEPHAQNLLLAAKGQLVPAGSLVHRDFGGFDIDFAYRRAAGLALPESLAQITSVEKDYKVSADPAHALKKLATFFGGGIVYNLDRELPAWQRAGRVRSRGALTEGFVMKMLVQELEARYAELSGRRIALSGDLRNVHEMLALRQQVKRRPLCAAHRGAAGHGVALH